MGSVAKTVVADSLSGWGGITPDRLLDDPLDDLLAELGVDVATVDADPGFTGGAVVRGDGSIRLVRPGGRPVAEWELVARAMLGKALRLPLPPLPASYELTEL
ncbi:hypothetical protein PV755_09355 [Streptomyces caniscabiei]|uniref:Uncharacterized protein n=1 Tax=Streptomyces caniscabiei TaxID=2746961 RepID=A0A927KY27_9ACTN|nr:hypothetical protein [Streptomyces caniscabiei]MBD9721937.1 hypothetical protein [Streptomyces caniscabiei]MDX3509128.1 hypothetical protein [Streptomyces caniscabiei]MDX3717119.1 hypothetical protein [Streptomyces caniscabiei]WEO22986.1 hypothetical protein IHE65_07370 [Streptomyces caniscabiei]